MVFSDFNHTGKAFPFSIPSRYQFTQNILHSLFQDARITIEGLEYLAENSMMQKAFRIFKSFKEWL
ncbi:YjcQ family protein [Limosilactobacillus fermentum]|uniref:YjcQ family protein n=1 Tax=Limosilactobacillus fermentum TaxID=1613 RepID=UPI003B9F3594